ncbi:hypothetical protein ACFX11_043826 [Malus domestica]
MVSPISILGFPFVHVRQTAAPRFSSLEDRVASLEATIASLPSLIDAAIEKAFASKLPAYFDKFRKELHSRRAGEGISAPLATDHYVSPTIKPIQLPRSPICAGGVQSQLIPATSQAPPLLSSSPLLRALSTSAVKPQSNDSVVTKFSLPASKIVIHASSMTIVLWLILTHSFPDTTKTGSEVLLLLGVIACHTDHSAFNYHAFLNAKYGWVNWYFVGKFVKKDFYALELFEEMSKRLNTYNMSLSSNLDAWDIVEDVAIAYEYNNITMRNQIPKSEPAFLKPLPLNEFTELIRLEIVMNGFTKVLTFILSSWQEIFPMSSYKDDKDVAKLKEIGESFIIEGNPESCTSWLSMNGEVLATGDKLMYLPCGLAAGSSITMAGSSHYAHEEYVSQLAKLRWGDGIVMVSQFMDELLTHGGRPCDNLAKNSFGKSNHM